MDRIIFHLKRFWPIGNTTVDLYEKIKAGKKTTEWRDNTEYWRNRLGIDGNRPRPAKAWFVVGYPRDMLPRLEADIIGVHIDDDQIGILFNNVKEIIE